MALDQSALTDLLDAFRSGGDLDFMREAMQLVLQALNDLEASEKIGAARYVPRGRGGRCWGISGLRPRPGRICPKELVESIVADALGTIPPDATHWSTRSMAEHAGVGKDTVARIWRARQIRPHRVETFKLSNDPDFEEKFVDVVGLYLNPPERAVALCFDEKSQCQALERTQPSLPLTPGPVRHHDPRHKRHGTTTLFAALDTATGKVLNHCFPRHRSSEFLAFLKIIDGQVPRDLDIHLELDNYAAVGREAKDRD
jgi:transposase